MSAILKYIIFTISIIEAIFIYTASCPREGLNYMFLVPFFYGILIHNFSKKSNNQIGLGLKIFFVISIVRYLIQPFLIILSNGELNHRMPNAEPQSYNVAILIYMIEMLISAITIKIYQKKELQLAMIQFQGKKPYNINILGWIVALAFLLILFSRLGIWLPELKILGMKEVVDEKAIVLEASFFNCLKGFFFVYFLAKSVESRNKTYLLLAIVSGLFNFMSYFGQNRSFIVETALTTIVLFTYAHSKYKKTIYTFFTPFASVIILFMFVTKQFGVDDVSDYDAGTKGDILFSYSNIIEEYVNGFWTVARSYQASINLSFELSVSAFIKDIVDGLSSLRDVPFLKTQVFPMTDMMLSSSDIFKMSLRTSFDYAQMLSFSGGFFIVFGEIFGWPAMILGNFLMIRLLVRMDVRSIICTNLYYKYIYIWMSCLLAFIHCYCMQTIIFCWSKYILFIWLILFANNLKNKTR